MLVRHAMNGGVIDAGAPTLAEQSIYTLIAIGAGAILIALDMRVAELGLALRLDGGRRRLGGLDRGCSISSSSTRCFTDESTGGIPFFNLLFLAYLLPAVAAGALALYARGKRPHWYSAMLGLLAAAARLRLCDAVGAAALPGRVHRRLGGHGPARDLLLFGAVAGDRRRAAGGGRRARNPRSCASPRPC